MTSKYFSKISKMEYKKKKKTNQRLKLEQAKTEREL